MVFIKLHRFVVGVLVAVLVGIIMGTITGAILLCIVFHLNKRWETFNRNYNATQRNKHCSKKADNTFNGSNSVIS